MKKIISLILVLVMCAALLAGCTENGSNETTAPAVDGLANAKAYLRTMYKDAKELVRKDFDRVGVLNINGTSYTVTWTVDVAEDLVAVVANGDTVTIDINEEPTEVVNFTLTATIAGADGNTETISFKHMIEAVEPTGTVFVDAPVAGTAYKFALNQNNLGQTLYFTGEMSGYYLATSPSPVDAVDVYLEEVDGGVRVFFGAEDNKTYIDIIPREGAEGKVNVVLTAEPTAVFTWDAERKTMVTTVEGNNWYLGCYSEYNTMSASNTSYIEDVSKIGDSQFPAGFCTVNLSVTVAADPAVETAYKFGMNQNNLGKTLYFTGAMDGYYLATSASTSDAVDVYLESVDGGLRLYFLDGETKTYIDIIPREGAEGKVNVVLTAEPSAVFTFDAERKTLVATVEGNNWYLGTYSEYSTISASNTSYIEDVSKIGDSQFPTGLLIVE